MIKKYKIVTMLCAFSLFCLVFIGPSRVIAATCSEESCWTVTQAPTPGESGYADLNCPECGEKKNVFISALNDEGWTKSQTNPSYDKKGAITYKREIEVNAFTHAFTYRVELPVLSDERYSVKINETSDRYYEAVYTDKSKYAKDVVTELPPFDNTDKWGISGTFPTCTNGGSLSYKLKTDNRVAINNVVMPKLGHNYEWRIESAPTAVQSGKAVKKCTHCEENTPENSETVLPPLTEKTSDNENYEYSLISSATLSSDGKAKYTLKSQPEITFETILPKLEINGFAIDGNGNLVLTLSDGSSQNLGKVVGDKGDKGDKGETGDPGSKGENGEPGESAGIDGFTVNESGNLILTYSDGTVVDLGKVAGIDGVDGMDGANGADGNAYKGIAIASLIIASLCLVAVGVTAYLFYFKKPKVGEINGDKNENKN